MNIPQSRVCVLLSGGLDSAVVLAQMLKQGRRVSPVYVQCGLPWEVAELRQVRRLLRADRAPNLEPLVVLELPLAGLYRVAGPAWSLGRASAPSSRSQDASVYLPGRNVWLLAAAALFCAKQGIAEIALGTLASNPFGDASPAFFHAYSRVLTRALHAPIGVITPLRRLTKAQVARLAGPAELRHAFSCLQPLGARPCGRCNKCAEHRRALRALGKRGAP